MKQDTYERVTADILSALEKGTVPWRKPWTTAEPISACTRKPYRGANNLLLSMSPHGSRWWATYRQIQALGGNVRGGERGTTVIFWKFLDAGGEEDAKRRIPLLRAFTVFNLDQTDGVDRVKFPEAETRAATSALDETTAESIRIAYFGVPGAPTLEHGGDTASYVPVLDTVRMPNREAFEAPAFYWSTLFHEMTHSTGAASRLNRRGITDPIQYGSHAYSREELVAEMGAAFLGRESGIDGSATLDNSAAYLQHWADVLRSDTRAVVVAAGQAQKAVDLIRGRSRGEVPEEATEEASA